MLLIKKELFIPIEENEQKSEPKVNKKFSDRFLVHEDNSGKKEPEQPVKRGVSMPRLNTGALNVIMEESQVSDSV